MRMRCVANYRNDARGLVYRDGQSFEVDDAIGAYLLKDAPGCFIVGVTEPKAAAVVETKPARAQNKGL